MVNRSGVKRDAGLLDSWQAKKPRSLPKKDEAATTPQKVSPKPMHISAAEPPPTVKKETNSKFHPLPIPKGVKHDVPVVDGGDSPFSTLLCSHHEPICLTRSAAGSRSRATWRQHSHHPGSLDQPYLGRPQDAGDPGTAM